MVDSPTQTMDDLADDIIFIRELQLHIVGLELFLFHSEAPFKDDRKSGTLCQTLMMNYYCFA